MRVTAARKRTRDLAEYIRAGAPKGADVLDVAVRELAPILDTEQTVGIRLNVAGDGVTLDSIRSPFAGAARVERFLRAHLASRPRSYASFDPTPPQRNVVLGLAEIERISGRTLGGSPVGGLFHQQGFALRDVVRSLLCDGPVLLAWFGAFRDRAFDERERGLLSRLVRPLRERLTLQRRLEEMPWVAVTMKVVLETTAWPRWSSGARCACTTPTRRRGPSSRPTARRSSPGCGTSWPVAGTAPGSSSPSRTSRGRSISSQCGAWPRATRLPGRTWRRPDGAYASPGRSPKLLAQGHSNRLIATALSCSESAVEQHVTVLLRRYDVEHRAELVARFWTDAVP